MLLQLMLENILRAMLIIRKGSQHGKKAVMGSMIHKKHGKKGKNYQMEQRSGILGKLLERMEKWVSGFILIKMDIFMVIQLILTVIYLENRRE